MTKLIIISLQWPENTRLKRVDEGEREDYVPTLAPLESKKMDIQFPSESKDGYYRTRWRLCYPAKPSRELTHFGP